MCRAYIMYVKWFCVMCTEVPNFQSSLLNKKLVYKVTLDKARVRRCLNSLDHQEYSV